MTTWSRGEHRVSPRRAILQIPPCCGFIELLEKPLFFAVLGKTGDLSMDPPRHSFQELIRRKEAGMLQAEPQEEYDPIRLVSPGVPLQHVDDVEDREVDRLRVEVQCCIGRVPISMLEHWARLMSSKYSPFFSGRMNVALLRKLPWSGPRLFSRSCTMPWAAATRV